MTSESWPRTWRWPDPSVNARLWRHCAARAQENQEILAKLYGRGAIHESDYKNFLDHEKEMQSIYLQRLWKIES